MEKEVEISLLQIISILWHKVWIIMLCTILGGGIGFCISNYMIEPTYSSSISMYVNNNTERTESQLNINDINASQKLVATYIEILKSDMVLDKVVSEMKLPYTNGELSKMITASSLNNTEILEVVVISHNPNEAADIANMLAEVAPPEIIRVVKAGGVQLIDTAVPCEVPIAPNIKTITALVAIIGAFIACMVEIVISMLDTTIKSEEDLQEQYGIPVLGVIPDIIEAIKKEA